MGHRSDNNYDLGGHALSAMFVRTHCASIDAEARSLGFVFASEFEESVIANVTRYLEVDAEAEMEMALAMRDIMEYEMLGFAVRFGGAGCSSCARS